MGGARKGIRGVLKDDKSSRSESSGIVRKDEPVNDES